MTRLPEVLHQALADLLSELLHGPPKEFAWMLNPGDAGLLRSLDKLSADDASRPAPAGGASVAAHVDHLRYGFELLNRWSRGENPFADADYSTSWERTKVTEGEWDALRSELASEAGRWEEVVRAPRDVDQTELTGMIASVAHLAYHVGAIRQIQGGAQGPAA